MGVTWHFLNYIFYALLLQEEAFRAAAILPTGTPVALITVTLAGVASAFGQSVVLFINRVSPRRFITTVLIASCIYVASYLLWTLSIWGISNLFFDNHISFAKTARAVGLGYAPQLFAFLVFVPFLGLVLDYLLRMWTLLAVMMGVHVVLALPMWQAFVCCVLGYLVLEVARRTLGYPLIGLINRLKAYVTGVPSFRDTLQPTDIIQEALEAGVIALKDPLP
jgi:hypothetical protein